MSESITNLEDAVAVQGALPVPTGDTALTDEQRAAIAALIGDAKPATPGLVQHMAKAVHDRAAHEHPTWEDLYCLNLVSWLGERMAPVLRRLLDAETQVAGLLAERHSTNESLSEVAEALRVQRDRIAELEAVPTTVYRAEHPDSGIVLETYSDLGQARLHCEASAGRDSDLSAATLSWIDDEEDGVYELVAELARDTEVVTGYIVTEVAVASEYDEEADE